MDEQTARTAIENAGIPMHCRPGLLDYLVHGQIPGSFLTRILMNDLHGAAGKADDTNLHSLHCYAHLLHNIPTGLWGSKEKMNDWADECRKKREEQSP